MKPSKDKTLIENRKAYHDYYIVDRLEVGIELNGAEVKCLRTGSGSIVGAYVEVLGGELWLVNSNIRNQCPFSVNKGETRNRKLLCHKKEITYIKRSTEAKGLTAVPLKVYDKNGKIKLEVGIAKGKNAADKRHALKDKDINRELKFFK